ncbi:MAG: hypothetical protein JXB88_16870 [Spirochaetales bacterium]|nr:hypothetical protein [Spirochaetales bacterium]
MILVFDFGTTVLKGGIIDLKGSLAAYVRQSLIYPFQTDSDINSPSPEKWIEIFISVSQKLIHTIKSMDIKAPVEGVVISGNGPTFVPVDAKGSPVCNAISWADIQSRKYIKELGEKTDKLVDPSFYLAKAYMLFKQKPELYEQVRWFLPCPEYISFFLTGNANTFLPAPGYTAYMWTDDVIIKTGMDKDKFPPFILMGSETGKVGKAAGAKTGIPPGIPVFAGGPDFIMSLLGTDTMQVGRICDRTGTSEGINVFHHSPVHTKNLTTFPHIREGFYHISCVIPFAGKVLNWFFDLLHKKPDEYRQFYSSLPHIPPGSDALIFLPHVEQTKSSLWPSYRKGVFAGLTIEHKKEHLFKAIIEGTGYTIREIFELFEKEGLNSEEVRVSGIQASYEEWNTIRANILGRRMLVPTIKDTELTGCACVGYTSLGYFGSFHNASEHMVCIEKIIEPDAGIHRIYTDLYDIYKKIYNQTNPALQELNEMRRMTLRSVQHKLNPDC